MIKTIFGKIMLLFMAIIMVSLFISGMMMSWVVRNAYLDDSEQQMLSVANDVDTLLSFYKSNLNCLVNLILILLLHYTRFPSAVHSFHYFFIF